MSSVHHDLPDDVDEGNLELPDFRGESGNLLTHSPGMLPPIVGRLKLLGADASEVAVPTGAIVESIDVVGDVRERDVAARIDPLLDSLLLQAAEERLDHGNISAVPLSLILGSR